MTACLFCDISANTVSSETVYESDRSRAFLDIHPHAPGHTVVIPKAHAETIALLPDEDVADLFITVKKMADALRTALGADGMTIGINEGVAAGQAIPHVHVHLMPRFAGDGGGSLHRVVTNTPRESLSSIAEKIKAVLRLEAS